MLFIGGRQTKWPAVEQALGELGIADGVLYVQGLEQARTHLESHDQTAPSVVLLSIDRIGGNGLDALKTLKANERLGRVPVVVLASSSDARLVNESFAQGAAGYLVEAADSREFAQAIRRIHDYWTLSELP
ncbi:MAG: hypothetical protein JW741_15630 [Sedimentisphaerales bacterium]|nr:hypothetical protein [Sedimentisphaerales bacterium]